MRYRLRFHLQELDLPVGVTTIGRSVDCNLTIEDPLVSRCHARIVIDDAGARLEDLGSRNGVRINGVLVRVPTVLRDGDRVRVGTQDLVFCGVGDAGTAAPAYAKTTGVLRLCANCRLPYPREVVSCPHCEAVEQTEERTLSGEEPPGMVWTIQLLVEALDRALALGRMTDAERIARRATTRIEEHLASGGSIDAESLETVAASLTSLTAASGDAAWALWVIGLHRRQNAAPARRVAGRLAEEAAAPHGGALVQPLREWAAHLRTHDERGPERSAGAHVEGHVEALAELERGVEPASSVAPAAGARSEVSRLARSGA